MKFKIASIQTNSVNNLEFNMNFFEEKVTRACEYGVNLVATPENVFFMSSGADDLMSHVFSMQNHPSVNKAQELAKQLKTWILIGSAAIKEVNKNKIANRSILIDDKGNINCYYDKIHLYKAQVTNGESHNESKLYYSGDKIVTCDLPWMKAALTICYDIRFPHLYRDIAKQGAGLIFAPAAFTKYTGELHWEVLLRARAIENGCYIVAPAQNGSHPANRQTFGHSMIIDPWGKVVANAKTSDDIIIAEIDPELVTSCRNQIQSLKHDAEYS